MDGSRSTALRGEARPGYAPPVTLRFCLLLTALVGCSGTVPESPEAGLFDARDVIVDPRDGAADLAPADADVQPTVDVVVFDAPAADATAPDVMVSDGVAPPPDASRPDGAAPDGPTFDLVVPEDALMTPCSDLAERYAAAVREAQACGSTAGCDVRVCETLCCTCEVFISGSADRMRALDDLRGRATALGCQPMLRCPIMRCPPARSGACSADGRCVTLRDPPSTDGGPAPDAPADR
jgi:hypothetical protein